LVAFQGVRGELNQNHPEVFAHCQSSRLILTGPDQSKLESIAQNIIQSISQVKFSSKVSISEQDAILLSRKKNIFQVEHKVIFKYSKWHIPVLTNMIT